MTTRWDKIKLMNEEQFAERMTGNCQCDFCICYHDDKYSCIKVGCYYGILAYLKGEDDER